MWVSEAINFGDIITDETVCSYVLIWLLGNLDLKNQSELVKELDAIFTLAGYVFQIVNCLKIFVHFMYSFLIKHTHQTYNGNLEVASYIWCVK